MHQIRGLVIFLGFFSNTCLATASIGGRDPIDPRLVEATVKILRSCYGDRVTPVGLAGKAAGTISKALWSQELSPVTLIDDTSSIVNDGPIDPKTRYKLQVFVVSASSPGTLKKILERVTASGWWNHMAAFLILHWPSSSEGCSFADFEMLRVAWEMHILNAKVMCHHRTNGRLIYTFNPYTSYAPHPWQFVWTYTSEKIHPWTVFTRSYRNGEGICNELDFDKTQDLGGYEIRVAVGDQVHRERFKSEGMCFDPIASDTCSIIFPALNATIKLFPRHFADSLGHVDENGKAYGILQEVTEGSIDIGFNGRSMGLTGNVTVSYPYQQTEMYAITQYSGYKSQLSKICSVIDSESRLGLYFVILITVLFFRYFVRPSAPNALLDTLRIICNSVLPIIPTAVAPRIYLSCLFFFAVTMQGIFQGRLASSLTKPEPLRNVNTMKDLAELGHKVYGLPAYSVLFGDPAFKGRYHTIRGELCSLYALRDSKAACVGRTRIITDEAAKHNLHLSRKPMAMLHFVLPMRKNFPLQERLNTLLMRSISGGLERHVNKQASYRSRMVIKRQEDSYKDDGIKVLTLEQLTFAFVILGIGLGLATVSFVVELIVGRHRRGSQKIRPGNIAQAAARKFAGQSWASTAEDGRGGQRVHRRRRPGDFPGVRIANAVEEGLNTRTSMENVILRVRYRQDRRAGPCISKNLNALASLSRLHRIDG